VYTLSKASPKKLHPGQDPRRSNYLYVPVRSIHHISTVLTTFYNTKVHMYVLKAHLTINYSRILASRTARYLLTTSTIAIPPPRVHVWCT
jgi:hypothetical protein